MSYRFLKLTTIYDNFAQEFLLKNPDFLKLSYTEFYKRFVDTKYGCSDFFSIYMKKLGNEAEDYVATFLPLQQLWARDNGILYDKKNWMKEIVFAQIKEYYPDVIYLQDLYTFTSALRNELREKCGNDVILIGSRSSPTKDFGSFRDLDLIVTAVPKYFEMFRLFGCKPLLLSHAFEHSLLDYFKPKPVKDIDFSFCGSLGTGRDDFSQRIAIMRKLLKETPLRIWGRTEKTNDSRSLQNFTKLLYHANVFMNAMGISREIRSRIPVFRRYAYCSVDPTVLPIDTEYQKRFYPPVFGLDYYSVLARSKIVLNIHGEDPGGEAVNMRLYEATGMGSCLLTDWMENLPSLFDPKKEVIAYRNANECIDNVGYLLENDDDREKIAKSGQERTLKNYTYEKKINQLHERILSLVQ